MDRQARVAVEGVVLPVSFAEFRGGSRQPIVEQLVSAHAGEVDAVVTTSMDGPYLIFSIWPATLILRRSMLQMNGYRSEYPQCLFAD